MLNALEQKMQELSRPGTSLVRRREIMASAYLDAVSARPTFPKTVAWFEENKDGDVSAAVVERFLNSTYMEECLLNSGAQ